MTAEHVQRSLPRFQSSLRIDSAGRVGRCHGFDGLVCGLRRIAVEADHQRCHAPPENRHHRNLPDAQPHCHRQNNSGLAGRRLGEKRPTIALRSRNEYAPCSNLRMFQSTPASNAQRSHCHVLMLDQKTEKNPARRQHSKSSSAIIHCSTRHRSTRHCQSCRESRVKSRTNSGCWLWPLDSTGIAYGTKSGHNLLNSPRK